MDNELVRALFRAGRTGRNLPCALLYSALVFSLVSPASSQTGEETTAPRFLSDIDPGYRALAEIQKSVCDSHPTQPCDLAGERCEKSAQSVIENLKRLYPMESDAEIEKITTALCNDRATPYEFPGSHGVIQSRVDNVRRLASEEGISLPEKVIFGALAVSGVNAEVEVQTESGNSIIMLNTRLMEFANELTKIAVQSLPTRESGSAIQIDTDQNSSERNIINDPEIRLRLTELIDYFYGHGHDTYRSPDLLSSTIQSAYDDGIETFVVAHEIGHIVHQDPTSSFNLHNLPTTLLNILHLEAPTTAIRLREVDADAFALSLLRRMRHDGATGLGESSSSVALSAVEFYFIAHHILEEAGHLAGYADAPPFYDHSMKADVTSITKCIESSGCRVRDLQGLSDTLAHSTEYPPDEFRGDLVRELIGDDPISSAGSGQYHQLDSVSRLVNRNVELLWELTRSEFIATHGSKH